jgi:Lon protease-like protein
MTFSRQAPDSLPGTLPVFPLSGVLLLPRGQLPLNIFEPRYLNMIDDALATDRMIGMIQPHATDAESAGDTAPVYEVGCAGRIASFSETGDGRYLITLSGVSRFRIARELDLVNGYRRVETDFAPFAGDLGDEVEPTPNRNDLLHVVRPYFEQNGMAADWSELDELPDDALVTALSMVSPFGPPEKQALLECQGLAERCRLLVSLMRMAAHDPDSGIEPVRH